MEWFDLLMESDSEVIHRFDSGLYQVAAPAVSCSDNLSESPTFTCIRSASLTPSSVTVDEFTQ